MRIKYFFYISIIFSIVSTSNIIDIQDENEYNETLTGFLTVLGKSSEDVRENPEVVKIGKIGVAYELKFA